MCVVLLSAQSLHAPLVTPLIVMVSWYGAPGPQGVQSALPLPLVALLPLLPLLVLLTDDEDDELGHWS